MNQGKDKPAPRNKAQERRKLLAAWRLHHLRCAREAIQRFLRAPISSIATALVIGIVLALPGLLGALAMNIGQLGEIWRGDAGRITLFLHNEIEAEHASQLLASLEADPLVERGRLILPEEGLRELTGRLRLEGIETLLEHNPLPNVIELILVTADPQQLLSLRQRLISMAEVESLSHDGQWLERLQKITDVATQFALIVLILLGLAVLFVISNTIRLELRDRQDEIRLLELIGATRAYVIRPLLYIGLITGLAGGLVASIIIAFTISLLSGPLSVFAATYGAAMSLKLPVIVPLGIIALSGALGWLGANVAGRYYVARVTTP